MSGEFAPLEPGEQELEDSAELLFRQMTLHHYDPRVKRPGSHAFGPADADAGRPSFSRSSIVTAQQSFDWHNAKAKSKSFAVLACSVGDVTVASEAAWERHSVVTRGVDDSAVAPKKGEPDKAPGHSYVDYRYASQGAVGILHKSEQRFIRGMLLAAALERRQIPVEKHDAADVAADSAAAGEAADAEE